MRQGKGPSVFFPVMAAALVIYAYVQLRCGRGEIVKSRFSENYLRQLSTFEQEYSFMEYAFVEFLLHVVFLVLLIIPVLMLATSISGLPFIVLIQGVSVIFTAALLCRLIGFMTYLLWGRGGSIGYLIARVLMCIFLFVTALNLPVVNPVRLLYALDKKHAIFWNLSIISGRLLVEHRNDV